MSIFILITAQVNAQYEDLLDDDIKVWTGMHVNKKVNSNLILSAKISYNTTSYLYSARFSDLGFKYSLPHNFRLAAFYRFVHFFEVEQMRIYTELEHRHQFKTSGFRLKSRLRWQHKRNTDYNLIEKHIRPMVSLSYQQPQWLLTPYVSSEFFLCYEPEVLINRFRITTGLRYSSIRFFYRYQKELNVTSKTEIDRQHTFNVSYRFNL